MEESARIEYKPKHYPQSWIWFLVLIQDCIDFDVIWLLQTASINSNAPCYVIVKYPSVLRNDSVGIWGVRKVLLKGGILMFLWIQFIICTVTSFALSFFFKINMRKETFSSGYFLKPKGKKTLTENNQ